MPLHLLPKKSWNVYSAANRARVARDEALAAARERDKAQEAKLRRSDSVVGLLRHQAAKESDSGEQKLDQGSNKRGKRRRLEGEDDTDRDLRHVKQQQPPKHMVKVRKLDHTSTDAPIVDVKGNISLFPITSRRQNEESQVSRENMRQRKADEELGTRLGPGGGDGKSSTAWYTRSSNNDSKAADGDIARLRSSDPLAVMKRAQRHLKSRQT